MVDESEAQGTEIVGGDGVPAEGVDAPATTPGRFRRFVRSRAGVAILIVLGVVVIIGALFAIPATRYPLAGLVVKKDARVTVVDSVTRKPVSGARVAAAGATATTDAKGVATLHGVAVGPQSFTISKQYYRDARADLLVPIAFGRASTTKRIVATGYPLEVNATDRITGAALVGAHIEIGQASAVTGRAGAATIVLPIKTGAQSGTVTADGYNPSPISADVSQRPPGATVELTTTGTLRFLSKATGTINVMQANLDGSAATVVLAGTGDESDDTTTLLSTRDWRYSALLANRGKRDALYLLTGQGIAPVTIDASKGYFTLAGWQGHTFFYQVDLDTPGFLAGGHTLLQAYNADTGKTTVIDRSLGNGASSTSFAGLFLRDGSFEYVRSWIGPAVPTGSTNDLIAVDAVTFKAKTVKSTPSDTFLEAQPDGADGLYVRTSQGSGANPSYFGYENGTIAPIQLNDNKFYGAYPTYLQSPSGKQTFWAESRDGKNTIFLGDESGNAGKQIAALSDFTPYGWFGADDRYILLTENDSELYIARAGVPLTATNVLKVTDYHKPPNGYPGYGSGYGG